MIKIFFTKEALVSFAVKSYPKEWDFYLYIKSLQKDKAPFGVHELETVEDYSQVMIRYSPGEITPTEIKEWLLTVGIQVT